MAIPKQQSRTCNTNLKYFRHNVISSAKVLGNLGRRLALVTLSAFLFSACMVGPDFVKPDVPVEQEWLQQRDARIKSETADTANWWTLFNDPVLNNLVQTAREQNLDLHVAVLRIIESRARLGIVKGLQYPQQQGIRTEASVNQLSKNAPNGATADRYLNNYDAGFDAAWELDFWGRFRRGVEAETAGLYVAMADYDNMLISLTAEVARTYVEIRTIEKRLEYARENIRLQNESSDIASERFKHGVVSKLDVTQSTALLKETESVVPHLEALLRQAKNSMAVLLGVLPSEINTFISEPSPIPTAPAEVSVGIPAELLRRRPDIRRAEFQAAAQSARIGVAKAELFPNFSLVGSIGLQSSSRGGPESNNAHFSDLFKSDSITYFFGPTVQWPILNYGRIKNNIRMQDARFQELLVNYRNTVLKAAQEVEDSMVGFLRSQETTGFLQKSVNNYRESVDISLLQYREGNADYQRVVDTQRFLTRVQDEQASSKGTVAQNLIAIYKALGGGWEKKKSELMLPQKIRKEMEERTDWGDMLNPTQLPDETIEPPTGKTIPLLPRPDW